MQCKKLNVPPPACAEAAETETVKAAFSGFQRKKIEQALYAARIPGAMAATILRAEESYFLTALSAVLAGDPALYLLVDKTHPFDPLKYAPDDLVELTGGTYRASRSGLKLRREAAAALERMARAALAEGVTLTASSAYRSYEYQVEVYARNVKMSGQETADRESAKPGYSQHQTGLVVDFGSITDAFAETAAGKWMRNNAARFGWSLSFPAGYEEVTGYRWESWHYRYTGETLAAFIDTYFGGIQQYALQFIYEWEKL
ncbi:MAG: M15 family metallopeptidase [Spirochaetaceae bacterium]|nr:M15 family metallopeptidase [Spirochaetaceae bacterium]